jgi:hypothetical protein
MLRWRSVTSRAVDLLDREVTYEESFFIADVSGYPSV